MTDEQTLARRLVACKHFRWMDGMVAIFSIEHGGARCRLDGDPSAMGGAEHAKEAGALPLLTDPATLGCLLALVREAWDQPKLYVSPHGLGWRMKIKGLGGPFRECSWGDTEAEALVAALLEAPCST
jgi:hypothetical protein